MNKYTVDKIIGEGSFGKAILVKSKQNGEQYVVKEIGISKMKPKEKDEARKEVTVLSKMRHPNIVQYTESFEENGKLYIVMEYCEGGDLYALINKQKGIPFKEQQVLKWFVQLCLALKHVHDRKILHRDIKTSNIFLTKSGTIKLGDFGIARVLNNTMELARTCIGTPYYLSPEICENKPYNNKSDVWALGCVVYETLTLKHAFEAGNMKNLVLKIIRGSYPPIPSRYSYDLRTLVSHLFRRNPRERPSINSILRKPFLAPLTEQFLTPKQHEEEFSHTVIHKGKPKPSAYKPSYGARYQPVGAKRMQNLEVRGGALGIRNRNQQIAAAYGPSVAAKKPKPIPSRVSKASHDKEDYLEKKRKQLIEEEKRRKNSLNEEKKKRLEELQKRQRERALKLKEEQLRRARDEARVMNLKRSVELWDPNANGEPDANLKKQIVAVNIARERPVSAPRERGDYDKYLQYLSKLESGDRNGAAYVAAPGLNRVKEAWEDRQKNQAAVLAAQVNRAAGEIAADRAQVVSEFLQRKKEAAMNKHRADAQLYQNIPCKQPNVGVAGALKPYSAAGDRVNNEKDYLARLELIRQQNYHDRKILHQKLIDHKNAYKVEISAPDDRNHDDERKKKMMALQLQAADRAKLVKENIEMRREKLDADEQMKEHDAKARARGILPPDERPVKYNPNPISITQALHAVGAPIAQKQVEPPIDEILSPTRADPKLRKKVLQRVNQRFSVDYEEEPKPDGDKENKKNGRETVETSLSRENDENPQLRPLPELPEKSEDEAESRPRSAWQVRKNEGDIVNELLGLPLQDTKALLEGTYSPIPVQPQQPDVKRQWQAPSGTLVRQLNQMTLQEPTLTLSEKTLGNTPDVTTERPLPKLKSQDPAEKSVSVDTTPSKELSVEKSPSVTGKTVVLEKASVDAAVTSSNTRASQCLLAANFRPLNQNGTYVISSLDVAKQSVEKEDLPEKQIEKSPKASDATKSPTNKSPTQVFAAIENRDEKLKYADPVKKPDVSDDVEEMKFINEVKSTVKTDTSRTAWSEESEPKPVAPQPQMGLSKSQEPAEKDPSANLKPSPPQKSLMNPKPSISSSPPVRSTRSSYSQDTLKLSRSNLDKNSTKSSSTSGSINRILLSSSDEPPVVAKINKSHEISSSTTNRPTENIDKTDPNPSDKGLYSTAKDQVLMKLTLGAFDSPNPKLLRTCSLPDLKSVVHDPQKEQDDSESSEDEDSKVFLAMQSMNDTNFDDGEGEDAISMKKSPDSEEEDEDEIEDLCANLQSVLDNSSKPDSSTGPSAKELSSSRKIGRDDSSSDEEGEIRINEDWQSDSDSDTECESSSCSEDISDTESVFSRLEDNREQLEKELGLEKFKKAYRYVQATHEDEDEGVRECQDRIRAVLGEKHDTLYPKILQLVMADGAYCEDNS